MRILALLAVAGALCIAVTACGSSGNSSTASTANAPSGETKDVATSSDGGGEVVVIGCPLTDPFCSAWKLGAEAAGPATGVKVNFIGVQPTAEGVSKGIEKAAASNPSGISAPGWFPEVEIKQFKQLTESGIPMVMTNANPSEQEFEESGALTVVGQDEELAGEAAGKIFVEEGLKTILCVNETPGALATEQRCAGLENVMKESGGSVEVLNIPAEVVTNPGQVEQAIKGAVSSDSSIEAAFTLGATIATSAVRAVGSQVVVGTCDVSSAVLEDVKAGKLLFSIDQQPYLQGYYSVLVLAQYNEFGIKPVGRVTSGPLPITKENLQTVSEINEEHPGVRGAQ